MVQHEKLFAAIAESNPSALRKEEFDLEFRKLVKNATNSELVQLCKRSRGKDRIARNSYVIEQILSRKESSYENLESLLEVPKSEKTHENVLRSLLEKAEDDLSKIFFVLINTDRNAPIRREAKDVFIRKARNKKNKTIEDLAVLCTYYLPDDNNERFIIDEIAKLKSEKRNLIINSILAFDKWDAIFPGSNGRLLALEKIFKIYQKSLSGSSAKGEINKRIKKAKLSLEQLTELSKEASPELKKAILSVALKREQGKARDSKPTIKTTKTLSPLKKGPIKKTTD